MCFHLPCYYTTTCLACKGFPVGHVFTQKMAAPLLFVQMLLFDLCTDPRDFLLQFPRRKKQTTLAADNHLFCTIGGGYGHFILSSDFVCSLFVIACGGISAAKKALYDTDDNGVLTSYTPQGAQFFKSAGRWYTEPEIGDVVYFYGIVSSEGRKRICHTGIVEWVDRGSQTFGTIEGNSNFDGFTTNGGSVARHEYSYADVGGDSRVNGFGRPRFSEALPDGVYFQIGG